MFRAWLVRALGIGLLPLAAVGLGVATLVVTDLAQGPGGGGRGGRARHQSGAGGAARAFGAAAGIIGALRGGRSRHYETVSGR